MKPTKESSHRLLVFTKPAIPGRVKTRLTSSLSPGQAARLHQAFLDDLLDRMTGGPFAVTLAWALEGDEEPPELVGRGLPGVRQRGRDLGERLYHGLADAGRGGARVVAAMGSDLPTVPRQVVEDAFRRIEDGADAALGPSRDGGYYLIAFRADVLAPELFEEITWSTRQVIGETVRRLGEARLTVALLPTHDDIDTPGDLSTFHEFLQKGWEDPSLCPRTARLLDELLTRSVAR
jgi:rSAM/selenodomain-associated transferase 1